MKISDRLYLVAGKDLRQRKMAIERIKQKISKETSACYSEYIIFGKDADCLSIKENVFTFSFTRGKILILRDPLKLSKDVKIILKNNLDKVLSVHYLIVESQDDYYYLQNSKKLASDELFGFILRNAQKVKISSSGPPNFMANFKKSIRAAGKEAVFLSLENLFKEVSNASDIAPLILGIMVNEVSAIKDKAKRLSCLEYIWRADRDIKEYGNDARVAVELLLIRLFNAGLLPRGL
ncbi:MAG: hypothetical protein ABH872_05085 [Candidatus Omnitrophota bacterium]